MEEGNLAAIPNSVLSTLQSHEVIVDDSKLYDFYYSELFKFNRRNYADSNLNLVIAPTTSCNFACPYCFEPKQNTRTMSTETINNLVQFIREHHEAKTISLIWYGGEPLLAFDKIKQIYENILVNGMPKIIFQSVVTNGYLLNNDVIGFFKDRHCNNIQITLDGIGNNNSTRCLKGSDRPTFDVIVSNIDKAIKELEETELHIRVNINKKNYTNYIEVKNYFKDKYPDNKMIYVYPGIIREEDKTSRTLCESSFKTTEILEMKRLLRRNGIDTSDFPKREYRGCIMHMANGYVIGPEGEIYKCWNDVGNSNAVVGNINNEHLTNPSLFIKYMVQANPFNSKCKDCFAFPICDGGCGYHRYRNLFDNCNFDVCSPYKDKKQLISALLSGIKPGFE